MLKKVLIIIGTLFASCYDSLAQSSISFEKTGYDQFMQKAKTENKLVMVYFTGSGCALCKKMEREVFVEPEVYKLYNQNFVNVESYDDWDKPDATIRALRKKYNIISNPTFLFLDSDGNIVHRTGYAEKDFFVTVARQASTDDNYRNWTNKIAAGDYSPEVVTKYLSVELPAKLYAEEGFVCAAQSVMDKYFKSIPEEEYTSAVNWNIINKYVYNTESDIFKYFVIHQPIFIEKYGKVNVDKRLFEIYYLNWSGNRNSAAYKKAEAMVRSSDVPMAKALVKTKSMNDQGDAIVKDKNARWQNFIKENNKSIHDYAHVINIYNVATWVDDICKKNASDKTVITTVNKWMQDVLAYPENKDYDYYATYAKTFYLLGDKANAIRVQKEAIELGKKDELDKEGMKELEDTLQSYLK